MSRQHHLVTRLMQTTGLMSDRACRGRRGAPASGDSSAANHFLWHCESNGCTCSVIQLILLLFAARMHGFVANVFVGSGMSGGEKDCVICFFARSDRFLSEYELYSSKNIAGKKV